MYRKFIFSNIGGSPSGKTISQYLVQFFNGLFGLTSFVIIISIIVLIYQAMNAKSMGDPSKYQDKIQKIILVLILALFAVVVRGAFT